MEFQFREISFVFGEHEASGGISNSEYDRHVGFSVHNYFSTILHTRSLRTRVHFWKFEIQYSHEVKQETIQFYSISHTDQQSCVMIFKALTQKMKVYRFLIASDALSVLKH